MVQDLKFTVPTDFDAAGLRGVWYDQIFAEECPQVDWDDPQALIELAMTIIKLATKPLEPLDDQLREIAEDFPQQAIDKAYDLANQYWGA
jgi:hypothetical protein